MTKKDLLIALLVTIGWAASFIFIKISTAEIPPIFSSSIVFFIMSAFMLPFTRLKKFDFKQVTQISILNTGYKAFLFLALALNIDIVASVILVQLATPLTTLTNYLLNHIKPSKTTIIGLSLSLIGVLIVIGGPQEPSPLISLICGILSSVFLALFNVKVNKVEQKDYYSTLSYVIITCAFILLFISFTVEDLGNIIYFNVSYKAIAAIIAMSLINIFTITNWFRLMSTYPVNLITPFSSLVPIFGVVFSALVYDIIPPLHDFIGVALTILGIYLINYISFKNYKLSKS